MQATRPVAGRTLIAAVLAIVLVAFTVPANARAAQVTDATGRTVTVPDQIQHVLPAGPPAAVLLAAIAPGRMIGFPGPISESARADLPPEAAALPQVPRLTGTQDVIAAVQALHPDLIVDYGTVSDRYRKLAAETQARTGIPTLLFDGSLDKIPQVARTLGQLMHQPDRAEAVARFAEAILALPPPAGTHPRVVYARGANGTLIAAPNTDVTAIFARLGWQVVAPEGTGTFRPAAVDAIRELDPDIIILSDAAAKDQLATPAWKALRAVRDGHVYIAPAAPFGWIEEPPSINRLIGLAWLRGADPMTLAAVANADLYGRVLTTRQLISIAGATPVVKP